MSETEGGVVVQRVIVRPVSKIHWYAIMAQPEMDRRVAADLAKQKFDVLLPRRYRRIVVRVGSTNCSKIEPEFHLSPYVFVGIDEAWTELSLKMVKDTLGVSAVVSLTVDGSPSSVPAELVRRMRADMEIDIDEASRRVRAKESPFKIGQEVEIRPEAPFGGFRGKVAEIRNGGIMLRLPNGFPVRMEDHEVIPVAWARPKPKLVEPRYFGPTF